MRTLPPWHDTMPGKKWSDFANLLRRLDISDRISAATIGRRHGGGHNERVDDDCRKDPGPIPRPANSGNGPQAGGRPSVMIVCHDWTPSRPSG